METLGLILIVGGLGTLIGAGIGFFAGYSDRKNEESSDEFKRAKVAAMYAYFMGGKNG